MRSLVRLAPIATLALAAAACAPDGGGAKPLTVRMSFPVAAAEEKTQCLVTRLGNDDPFDFDRIESVMAPGSHHLILYRDASSLVGQAPPPEGLGACDMDSPRLFVYGAQEPVHENTTPAGVAAQLPADALVILEAHYANASDEPIEAEVDVTLSPADPASIRAYAGTIFYMDTAFQVPPGSGIGGQPVYSHETTCSVPAGVNVYRLGSHAHKRMVRIDAWQRDVAGQRDVALVYQNTDWHEPVELTFPDDAPLAFGADQGIRFECAWTNETSSPIGFGNSVEDEMCIVGAGYWPKVEGPLGMDGNLFCVDGTLYY